MEKQKMETTGIVEGNIDKIRALFPHCITEVKGADGKIRYAVDFDNRCTRKAEPDCIWKSLPYCTEHVPEDVTVCFVNDKDYTLGIYFLDILLS